MVGKAIRLQRHMALVVAAVAALAAMWVGATPAHAAKVAPGWEVQSIPYPTHFKPGGEGYILVQVFNVGAKASSGPITVTDVLPEGMVAEEAGRGSKSEPQWACKVGRVVTCTSEEEFLPDIGPGAMDYLVIAVKVPETAGSGQSEVTVSGGGAAGPASSVETFEYSDEPAPFGFKHFDGWFSSEDGSLGAQAGSHLYTLATDMSFANTGYTPNGEIRSVTVNLPRGLVGNPTAVPRCTSAQFNNYNCPPSTQVGVIYVGLGGIFNTLFKFKAPIGANPIFAPELGVFNLVPPPGTPAQLGFQIAQIGARINTKIRSGSDYGITASINNIPQRLLTFSAIVLWGEPGDESHNYQRLSRSETGEEELSVIKGGASPGAGRIPFLTLPTSCEGPLKFTATTSEWGVEGKFAPISEATFTTHTNAGLEVGLSGCDRLHFTPAVSVAPDTTETDTPAGLTVEVETPQEALDTPGSLVASNIKDTTVTLPEGVAINPAQAHGLAVCSKQESAVGTEAEPTCPSHSEVGTDEIETPLLSHDLKGKVYVLDSNPPNLKLLMQASGEGVHLKLVGDVHLDEATGRLTTTFSETPELPFTKFRLSFSGGPRAAVTTPTRCGSYTTTSDFTPWAAPTVLDAFPTSEFQLSSGPGGSPCPGAGPLPFAPTLTAGSTTDQAGGFTNFSMLLTREDGQQRIGSLQFKTPPGLLGRISKVQLCDEAHANAGTCPAASQIGHTVVEAGPGPYPLVVPEPGQPPAPIYLTEGYKGAPYGLSIVVPLHVGPFTLQTQIVRAKIEVDPITTQLTITTDPLPTIIDGVPADLRAINAVIDRSEFMFNPTNCTPSAFSGTAFGSEGSKAAVSTHFGMGSCRQLKFKPKFAAATSAHTSRKDGASLKVMVSYPKEGERQAGLRYVKVELPRALPSRLSTLKKACVAATFNADPTKCPAESMVGHAVVHTPVLSVPLEGSAYFVSEGSEWPELIMVLKGGGVTVDLIGETLIKNGVTSSTFKSTPDVPFEGFELTLPRGRYSALTANSNLCKGSLVMPTRMVGQNGKVVEQKTKIHVGGCKPAIYVLKKQVQGAKARIVVQVPSAGRLTANGKGIGRVEKRVRKGGRTAVTIHLQRGFAARHGHRVKVRVHLTFKASHGKAVDTHVKVRLR